MLWFVFSLLTAISEATKDAISKKGLERMDEYMVAWLVRFMPLPFFLILLLFVDIPPIDTTFWIALVGGGTINVIATIMFVKAIKISPLSLTLPMLTFTPIFLLLTSPIMVGEFPSLIGIAGILLIVLGAYMLNIKDRKRGIFSPFRSLVKERGPLLMLCVAAMWSITSNFDKIGMVHSNLVFWLVSVYAFLSVFLFLIMLCKSKRKLSKLKNNVKIIPLFGIVPAMIGIFQMTALTLTIVPYVISIKRTSSIFGTLYGYFLFREKEIKQRMLGAVIMVMGVLLITLF